MAWSPLETWHRWRNKTSTATTAADEETSDEVVLPAEETKPSGKKTKISIIKLHGVIDSDDEQTLNIENLREPIEDAFKRWGTKAVFLDISSPGGSPVEAHLIANKILRESTRHDIPVYAFVHEAAASAGYWIACAADYIYATPVSFTGSIGVISAGFGFDKLIANLGIERRIYTSGEHKSKYDPYMPVNPRDVEKVKETHGELHELFKNWVRQRRGDELKIEGTDELKADESVTMSGDYWLSEKALEYGLIDGIDDMENFLEVNYGDKVDCKEFAPSQKSLLRKIFFSSALGNRSKPETIASSFVDAAVKKAKVETLWAPFKYK